MSHALASAGAHSARRESRGHLVGRAVELAAVLALAGFVGLWRPGAANIGPDEAVYQEAGLAYVRGDLTPNPEHPPLAKLLMGLWQLLFGEGVESVRVLMGLVLMLSALTAYLWLRAAEGRGAALIAAVLLITFHRVAGDDFIDRQVSLDPFAVCFGLIGLAVLWCWRRQPTVVLALLSGAAFACAILSKATAAVFLVGALGAVPWRRLREPATLRGIAAFAVAGIVLCFAVYLPFGGLAAVGEMVEFQSRHAEKGHPIEVAGVVHVHAPVYAVAWFAGEALGWFALAGVVLGTGLSVLRWREPAARMLLLTAAGTFVVLSLSPVALPHYTQDWLWAALLASGIGLAALWRRTRTPAGVAVAAVPTALLLWGALTGLVHVATIAPTGVGRVDEAMHADPGPDGTVLTVLISPLVTGPNIDAPTTTDAATEEITAVLVGTDARYEAYPELLTAIGAIETPVDLDGATVYLLDDELADLLPALVAGTP